MKTCSLSIQNKEDNIMTTKENIIRKLTSRKLWVAVSEFVAMLIVALGVAENTATQVAALIMAGAGAIGYIIGEGLADAGHAE